MPVSRSGASPVLDFRASSLQVVDSGLDFRQHAEEFILDLLSRVKISRDFIELSLNEDWLIDLKYATTDNFMKENVYGDFRAAYLHKIAYEKLLLARRELNQRDPSLRLMILDVLRPRSVQRVLWSKVCGTSKEEYVANPEKGSMHNYGMAVDLTLATSEGLWLDMGSGFDDFRELSQPILETHFFSEGQLSSHQLASRHLLRSVMEFGGFESISSEWWHFNALPREDVFGKFPIVE